MLKKIQGTFENNCSGSRKKCIEAPGDFTLAGSGSNDSECHNSVTGMLDSNIKSMDKKQVTINVIGSADSLPCIWGKLNGHRVRMLIDTGTIVYVQKGSVYR